MGVALENAVREATRIRSADFMLILKRSILTSVV